MNNKEIGQRGEQSAADFLCGKGFKIIGRNVRVGHLETDIIAKNDRNIVFAEVKTRKEFPNIQHRYGRPSAAVDYAKQRKIILAAEEYMRRNRSSVEGLIPRIDVVEVYLSPLTESYKVLKIVHMENAVHK